MIQNLRQRLNGLSRQLKIVEIMQRTLREEFDTLWRELDRAERAIVPARRIAIGRAVQGQAAALSQLAQEAGLSAAELDRLIELANWTKRKQGEESQNEEKEQR